MPFNTHINKNIIKDFLKTVKTFKKDYQDITDKLIASTKEFKNSYNSYSDEYANTLERYATKALNAIKVNRETKTISQEAPTYQ